MSRPAGDPQVKVRCMAGGCRTDYVTSRAAYDRRGCCCPICGESKTQLREEVES